MKIGGENLGKNVGDIVTGSNELELNDFVMNLLAKPVHLDTEMTVSSRDNVVANHSYTGLIVFEKARSAVLVKTQFSEQISQPQYVFRSLSGGDVFNLSCAKTHSRSSLGKTGHQTTGQVDGVTIPGA